MQEDGKPTPVPSAITDWRELASRASEEPDPRKLSELVERLCDRLDEIEQEKKSGQSATSGMDGCKQEVK